jgi:hypothetical protein
MLQSLLDNAFFSDALFLGGPALLVLLAGGLLYSGLAQPDRFRIYLSGVPLTAVPFIIYLQTSRAGDMSALIIVPALLATAASIMAGLWLLLLLPDRFVRHSLLLALGYPSLLLVITIITLHNTTSRLLIPPF